MENSAILSGRYALVTGATKGIGRSVALVLAAAGCNLMLAARSERDLNALSDLLREQYPKLDVQIKPTDCGEKEALKALAHYTASVFPFLSILVNNVGLFRPGTLLDEQAEDLEMQMAVNVYSAHYLSVFFGRKMCERKHGHIFNIGSVAGKKPVSNAASYSVTKYALHGLTAIMRQEFGSHGVKVTELIPGATFTSSWEGTLIPEERFVQAQDIALALLHCLTVSQGANIEELIIRPLDKDL